MSQVSMQEAQNKQFGKDPLLTQCSVCQCEMVTRVEGRIARQENTWESYDQRGMPYTCSGTFIAACICCGPLFALLLLCLPGFREYDHFCSRCNNLLGSGNPKHSTGHTILIILMVLLHMAAILVTILYLMCSTI